MTNNRYNTQYNERNTAYRPARYGNHDRYNEYNDQYVDINAYSRYDRKMREDRRANTAQRKPRRSNVVVATIAICLTIIAAASILTIGIYMTQSNTAAAAPASSVSTTADNSKISKAQHNSNQDQQQTAAQTTAQTAQDNSRNTEDNIKVVNGERIYIDTKRPIPQNSGTPYHYNPYGKTSYGFDWDYSADNNNFLLRCDYNFTRQQYDFQFYGLKPGVAHVTLYYNTDDYTQVPVQLTINVDNDLNATAA